jgi:GTP diphosphokinase / guanosine-3',5'-bis(diphosphate) 3'-diphosphatase
MPIADLLVALEFSAHKHRDQRRKDASASPYINHPIALARLLAVEGGVTEVKMLAHGFTQIVLKRAPNVAK